MEVVGAMGKYNSNKLTSKFVQNYIKNRLWEKNHSEYVPFLNVRSVPTKGKSNRIMSSKTGREHHFLSKLEYAAFYYFDYNDEVSDIKEQYPLLPIEILQNIALEAGIEYPNFNNEPIIMTTDFFLTVKKNDKLVYYARTVKLSSDLSNERIIEKFEIEKRFFNSKGIDWGIITEKELSNVFVNNMEILHSNMLTSSKSSSETQYIFTMYKQLAECIEKNASKNMPVAYSLSKISKDLNITFSNINKIFFKGITDKIFIFDIYNKSLDITTLTISDVKVNNEMLSQAVSLL